MVPYNIEHAVGIFKFSKYEIDCLITIGELSLFNIRRTEYRRIIELFIEAIANHPALM